jgi:methylated-DNA-protein-cysteine methyltransferase related protein
MKKTQSEHNFFDDVYAIVSLIPKGRATSYGAIAHYLGLKSSARMVGWAMHACPAGLPAHRVVNSLGLLTGKHHFKTPYHDGGPTAQGRNKRSERQNPAF